MSRSKEWFFDKTQPEYLFTQFFGLELEIPLVKERAKQFLIKVPILMFGLVLMRFFIFEIMPPFFGMILTAILLYFGVYLLIKYFILVNKMVKANSILGLIVCIMILMLFILVI